MKLEVGMYVRNDKGLLGKLISKEKDGCGFILEYEGQYAKTVWSSLGNDDEVIKASHNIIDLIEVGDYVNGYKVADIDKSKYSVFIEEPKDYVWQCLWTKDIKSIVTKEQFESMSYKVED